MKKVSIIVPIYNAENTIEKCVESILHQTYKNIEVLLINDGSTDESASICESYLLKDNRVKLYSRENTGPSDTRNFGIKIASGDFIQFVDADDIIDMEMTEQMVKSMSKGIDLCICGVEIKNNLKGNIVITERGIPVNKIFTKRSFLDVFDIFYEAKLINAPWNKLYIKDLILRNSIIFDSRINLGEDLLFNLAYLEHCNGINTVNKNLYKYSDFNNNSSLTKKYDDTFFDNQLFLLDSIEGFISRNNVLEHKRTIFLESCLLSQLIYSIKNLLLYSPITTKKTLLLKIHKMINHNKIRLNNNYKGLSLKRKILKLLVKYKFTLIIYRLLKQSIRK